MLIGVWRRELPIRNTKVVGTQLYRRASIRSISGHEYAASEARNGRARWGFQPSTALVEIICWRRAFPKRARVDPVSISYRPGTMAWPCELPSIAATCREQSAPGSGRVVPATRANGLRATQPPRERSRHISCPEYPRPPLLLQRDGGGWHSPLRRKTHSPHRR